MDANEARHLAERIDTLLDEVQRATTPAVYQRVEELVRSLVGLYGAGLERAVELVAGPGEPDRLRTLADDDLVGSLLVLHDLHPDDVLARVQGALDRVRPYLGSHAGGVTLVGVDPDGIVRLRLEGSCEGCPSSAMTVQNAIEDAILTAAPDVLAVEVEGVVSADPPLLQIEPFSGPREGGDPGWVHVDVDVPPGAVSLALVAGEPLLVAGLPDSAVVAYRDRCAACSSGLVGGTLHGETLTCPSCASRFDLRHAGRSMADDGRSLVPVPMLPDGVGWRVSVREPVGSA